MIFSEVIGKIRGQGIVITEPKLRWAIKTNRLPSPQKDAMNRYQFDQDFLDKAVKLFGERMQRDLGVCVCN